MGLPKATQGNKFCRTPSSELTFLPKQSFINGFDFTFLSFLRFLIHYPGIHIMTFSSCTVKARTSLMVWLIVTKGQKAGGH